MLADALKSLIEIRLSLVVERRGFFVFPIKKISLLRIVQGERHSALAENLLPNQPMKGEFVGTPSISAKASIAPCPHHSKSKTRWVHCSARPIRIETRSSSPFS
jgi:hypothetical protein